jgi:alkylated DNA nucleotide flippase Atl1
VTDGLFKDDVTIALDEVDRLGARAVTVYHDLARLAAEPDTARWLDQAAARLTSALNRYHRTRVAHQQIPESGDPERAHVQALWLRLKAGARSGGGPEAMRELLEPLTNELTEAIRQARAVAPAADLADAIHHIDEIIKNELTRGTAPD